MDEPIQRLTMAFLRERNEVFGDKKCEYVIYILDFVLL